MMCPSCISRGRLSGAQDVAGGAIPRYVGAVAGSGGLARRNPVGCLGSRLIRHDHQTRLVDTTAVKLIVRLNHRPCNVGTAAARPAALVGCPAYMLELLGRRWRAAWPEAVPFRQTASQRLTRRRCTDASKGGRPRRRGCGHANRPARSHPPNADHIHGRSQHRRCLDRAAQ